MSYTVEDSIQDSEGHLAFLKSLKEAYPDAIQQGSKWSAPSLKGEDCDGIDLDTEKSYFSETFFVFACPYRKIAQGRVYHSERILMHSLFTDDLKLKNPELFDMIMRGVKL